MDAGWFVYFERQSTSSIQNPNPETSIQEQHTHQSTSSLRASTSQESVDYSKLGARPKVKNMNA